MFFFTFEYFNSIKVRLERNDDQCSGYFSFRFQFHKGTIRTLSDLDDDAPVLHFNSIKVRLERYSLPPSNDCCISIP